MIDDVVSRLASALLPGALWKNRMNSLTAAVTGLILAGRASIWKMGIQASGRAQPVSRGKRVFRLLHNLNVDVDSIARCLIQVLTEGLTDVVVAIDWTEFGNWQILKAAIVTKSRGIPVYWTAVKGRARRTAEVEKEFCEALLAMIPVGKRLLIIGDRGFDSANLVQFLIDRGIDFVLRFGRHIAIQQGDGDFVRVKDIPLEIGQQVDYGVVRYTKASAVPARVVRTWQHGQDEEWNLVTNLEQRSAVDLIVRVYGRRFTIEELFKDYKGGQWELAKSGIQTEATMERLVLVLAVAHIVLVSLGRWVQKNGLERQFRSQEGGLSLFTLGERLLHDAARGNTGLLFSARMEHLFHELPITLDEIMTIPWAPKKPAKVPKPEIPRDRLNAYMYTHKLSPLELAGIIGCQQGVVSQVAMGRVRMPRAWYDKLFKYADMTMETFLSLPSPPPKNMGPKIPYERLQAWMSSQSLTQVQTANIVRSHQPRISRVVKGEQPFPPEWLPLLLEHADMSMEDWETMPVVVVGKPLSSVAELGPMDWDEGTAAQKPPRLSSHKPVNSHIERRPPRPGTMAPEETDKIPTMKERTALRVLWRRYKQTELASAMGVAQYVVSRALSGQGRILEGWIESLCTYYELTRDEFLALADTPGMIKTA